MSSIEKSVIGPDFLPVESRENSDRDLLTLRTNLACLPLFSDAQGTLLDFWLTGDVPSVVPDNPVFRLEMVSLRTASNSYADGPSSGCPKEGVSLFPRLLEVLDTPLNVPAYEGVLFHMSPSNILCHSGLWSSSAPWLRAKVEFWDVCCEEVDSKFGVRLWKGETSRLEDGGFCDRRRSAGVGP